jgi:hypothetical protein
MVLYWQLLQSTLEQVLHLVAVIINQRGFPFSHQEYLSARQSKSSPRIKIILSVRNCGGKIQVKNWENNSRLGIKNSGKKSPPVNIIWATKVQGTRVQATKEVLLTVWGTKVL